MNDYIAFSAYFGAALTLIIYVVSFRISDRIGHPLANPILICLALLIGALLIFDIDYDAYNQRARAIKKQTTNTDEDSSPAAIPNSQRGDSKTGSSSQRS